MKTAPMTDSKGAAIDTGWIDKDSLCLRYKIDGEWCETRGLEAILDKLRNRIMSPPPPTLDIDDILNEFYHSQPPFSSDDVNEMADWQEHQVGIAKQAILAILAQEVKRVIGEDEQQQHSGGISSPEYVHYRNGLRAEQRRKTGLV